jgi:hypothetical protein
MYLGLYVYFSYTCQILIRRELSRQIFEKKFSNIKFGKNPCSGSRIVPCGRTDRQTDRPNEADSRFSKFCESAQKLLSV